MSWMPEEVFCNAANQFPVLHRRSNAVYLAGFSSGLIREPTGGPRNTLWCVAG